MPIMRVMSAVAWGSRPPRLGPESMDAVYSPAGIHHRLPGVVDETPCLYVFACRGIESEKVSLRSGCSQRFTVPACSTFLVTVASGLWVDAAMTTPWTLLRVPVTRLGVWAPRERLPNSKAPLCMSEADQSVWHLTMALSQRDSRSSSSSKTKLWWHLEQAVLYHVLQTYLGMTGVDGAAGPLTTWQLEAISQAVDNGVGGDTSTRKLAELCGLDTDVFRRSFEATTHQSPRQWVLRRRLDAAAGHLRSSMDTVAEIANRCGFADQSHLTRTFKQQYGITPSRYRRAMAKWDL